MKPIAGLLLFLIGVCIGVLIDTALRTDAASHQLRDCEPVGWEWKRGDVNIEWVSSSDTFVTYPFSIYVPDDPTE